MLLPSGRSPRRRGRRFRARAPIGPARRHRAAVRETHDRMAAQDGRDGLFGNCLADCPRHIGARNAASAGITECGVSGGRSVVRPAGRSGFAHRFAGVWLHDLVRVESNGDERAISSKGALGLMQVMPATYAMLRASLGLGADPLEPRDNILAGATYLRMLVDRYGWPGALAAYNAGPGRLNAFLMYRRPLPAETIDYLWRLDRSAGLATPISQPNGGRAGVGMVTQAALVGQTPRPSRSSLFVSSAASQRSPPANAGVAGSGPGRPAATITSWRMSGLFAPTTANPAGH